MPAHPFVSSPLIALLTSAILLLAPAARAETPASPQKKAPHATLSTEAKVYKSDFDVMLKHRVIRVAVPYSRTLFFNDKGVQRGLTAESLQQFERWLNKKYKTGSRPITVYAIPGTRDKLLQKVIDGKAEIAAGNLTITPERDAHVDFSSPLNQQDIFEVVVTGPASPELTTLDDLAGKEVHVRPSSSYHTSLKRLNEVFRQAGKPAMTLRLVPDALEDEDMMDMLNAGVLSIIVVDDWKAELWAGMLDRLQVHQDIRINDGGRVGWAFREGSPQLAAVINEFLAENKKVMGSAEQRLAAYQRRLKAMKNPTTTSDWQRFEQTLQFFKVYGNAHHRP